MYRYQAIIIANKAIEKHVLHVVDVMGGEYKVPAYDRCKIDAQNNWEVWYEVFYPDGHITVRPVIVDSLSGEAYIPHVLD